MESNLIQTVGTKLNLSTHYSLIKDGDITYLLNGDITSNENAHNNYYVQNMLSNRPCSQFNPLELEVVGLIPMNVGEYAVFSIKTVNDEETYEIGVLSLVAESCSYVTTLTAKCLNFKRDYPVRGVYKTNAKNNAKRVYFVDGFNPNRYFEFNNEFVAEMSKGYKCNTCTPITLPAPNCDYLDINKKRSYPCATLIQGVDGSMLSGVYQVGIAYMLDDVVVTDYYFSPPVKMFSENSNISINIDLSCNDGPLFSEYSLALITQTRESGLVIYELGTFDRSVLNHSITDLTNAIVLPTEQALLRRIQYDRSLHIASNSEVLLLGYSQTVEQIAYQRDALDIDVEWVELKVNAKDAHKYPSLMRDEVYSFAIEWIDSKGNSRGIFHIPGRAPIVGREIDSQGNFLNTSGTNLENNDVYELEGCAPAVLPLWQVLNTSFVDEVVEDLTCEECQEPTVSKRGRMGYWESEDYTYPDNGQLWSTLACKKIRHHKMPSNEQTHIHDNGGFVEVITENDNSECITEENGCPVDTLTYDDNGVPIGFTTTYLDDCDLGCNVIERTDYIYEDNIWVETTIRESTCCTPTTTTLVYREACANILTVNFKNIKKPATNLDIVGYRIHVGDRKGNKSILHKGLIFNAWQDTSSLGQEILYPNYPFNDLHDDVFLTKTQTPPNVQGSANLVDTYSKVDYTYHSPDIHYRELKQEFGTEIKYYGLEVGKVKGKFEWVYKHPETCLDSNNNTPLLLRQYGMQMNSVANFDRFYPIPNPLQQNVGRRYKILDAQYLLPINQIISNGKKFNNYLRESSFYISIQSNMTDWTSRVNTFGVNLQDRSRILPSEFINPNLWNSERSNEVSFGFDNKINRNGIDLDSNNGGDGTPQANSYYVGIKIKNPNQYGTLERISYRPVTCVIPIPNTESDYFDTDNIYGGDIYISKHSLLRKMPMFKEWLYNVPIGTEIDYRLKRNAWYPRFWYEDLGDDEFCNLCGQDTPYGGNKSDIKVGSIFIFVNGVIDYWCESEFIGNYREQDFTPNGQFYPKIDENEIARNDKVIYDNKFLYNITLLRDNVERKRQDLDPADTEGEFTVSYSLKDDPQAAGDRWLQFLPLNYTILPRIYGRFTGMHYTDQYSLFFIFEDQILYSQVNFSLNTREGASLILGEGDIFTNRLLKLSNESTGYAGSLDPLSFVNTRAGTFFLDRKRKKVFQWAGQLKDVTENWQPWLNRYLFDGATGFLYRDSAVGVFDNWTGNLFYTDKRTQWTASYKPGHGLVSFHSFIPTWYLSMNNTFATYVNKEIWTHNRSFNSNPLIQDNVYQTYYGVQVPFIVGFTVNNKYINAELQNIEVFSEWMRYSGYNEPIYVKKKFFDKIFAFNNNGSTGIIPLVLKDKRDPKNSMIQNLTSPLTAEVTLVNDGVYRINKLESVRINPDTTSHIDWSGNGMTYVDTGVDKNMNPRDRADLKGKWVNVHLISDTNNQNKILVQLLNSKSDQNTV